MSKFVRKIEVEALEYTKAKWRELRDFLGMAFLSYDEVTGRIYVAVQRGEATISEFARPSDWITKEPSWNGNGQLVTVYRIVPAGDFTKEYAPVAVVKEKEAVKAT